MIDYLDSKNYKKILLLIPYFGEWPKYFELYLSSCSHNEWLQILFITDLPIPKKYPNNIRFEKSSLNEISSLIEVKLSLSGFALNNAYKLCDFKPTYGIIFDNYTIGYEYWGYGDIDLFYGNLEEKVKYEISKSYDVISAREEIVSGSFTLIKNNNYNNNLFKKLDQFEKLAKSERYEGIDETSHNSEIWFGLGKLELPKSCFTYIVAKESELGNIKSSFKTFICENLPANRVIKFKKGQLYLENKTLGYFHYVMNKRKIYFDYPNWKEIPDIFYITDSGFYKYLWMGKFFGPIKKFFGLTSYYVKKSPKIVSKVMNKL
ncbi:DUF6625 family protein [Pedobacter cryotolerans]|uniref:Uncharacterized protein n=1 Tax=Pedobacter cryotolerans TaxID=2571270 RepID=A0A4U1C052_9SPHI|nr:DUF6625 family protein [Pedobacter cryotolerans]TKB98228.1 hypothetical protein FA045_14705 [Pedobacter cryotolerans]